MPKKLKPETNVTMASHKERASTAYVPVTKARIIAAMAIMVRRVAYRNNLLYLFNTDSIDIMKWIKTAVVDNSRAKASDMTNA